MGPLAPTSKLSPSTSTNSQAYPYDNFEQNYLTDQIRLSGVFLVFALSKQHCSCIVRYRYLSCRNRLQNSIRVHLALLKNVTSLKKLSPMQSPEKFHAFAAFPVEIQDLVWRWALPPPQILHVNAIVNRLRILRFSRTRPASQTPTNYDWIFVNEFLDVVALRVCQRSRNVALLSGYCRVWLLRDPSHWRWFNFNYDTMFLNSNTSEISTSRGPDCTPLVFPVRGYIGRWKNLAVSEAVWIKWPFKDLQFALTMPPEGTTGVSSRRGSAPWDPWSTYSSIALTKLESLEIVLWGEKLRTQLGSKATFVEANMQMWRRHIKVVEDSFKRDLSPQLWSIVSVVEAFDTRYMSVV